MLVNVLFYSPGKIARGRIQHAFHIKVRKEKAHLTLFQRNGQVHIDSYTQSKSGTILAPEVGPFLHI